MSSHSSKLMLDNNYRRKLDVVRLISRTLPTGSTSGAASRSSIVAVLPALVLLTAGLTNGGEDRGR